MRRSLPRTLTTLDLLKAWAVLLMLVDFTGAFLFPVRAVGPEAVGDPVLWIRAFGRLSVPVWFFLIGYARSRDLSLPIWIAAFFMLGLSVISGLAVFPLDVLFTIILIRLTIDRIAAFAFERSEHFGLVLLGLGLFVWAGSFLIDYGSVAFLLALVGWAVRHRQGDHVLPLLARPHTLQILYWAAFVALFFHAALFFSFGRAQLAVASLGGGLVLHMLMDIRLRDRPDLALRLGPVGVAVLQTLGRHTLAIYVSSILFLVTLCWGFGFGLPLYRFMDWEWTIMESMQEMYATTGTRVPPTISGPE